MEMESREMASLDDGDQTDPEDLIESSAFDSGMVSSPESQGNDAFVPSSLRMFVAQAKATLQDTQLSLQAHLETPPKFEDVEEEDDGSHTIMVEDEEDRRLKSAVLHRFKHAREGTSSKGNAELASPSVSRNLAHELHVSANADVSPEVPKTPPSPRASTGYHHFWDEEVENSEQQHPTHPEDSFTEANPNPEVAHTLFVSPENRLPETTTTVPSTHTSTGSHSFWNQAMETLGQASAPPPDSTSTLESPKPDSKIIETSDDVECKTEETSPIDKTFPKPPIPSLQGKFDKGEAAMLETATTLEFTSMKESPDTPPLIPEDILEHVAPPELLLPGAFESENPETQADSEATSPPALPAVCLQQPVGVPNQNPTPLSPASSLKVEKPDIVPGPQAPQKMSSPSPGMTLDPSHGAKSSHIPAAHPTLQGASEKPSSEGGPSQVASTASKAMSSLWNAFSSKKVAPRPETPTPLLSSSHREQQQSNRPTEELENIRSVAQSPETPLVIEKKEMDTEVRRNSACTKPRTGAAVDDVAFLPNRQQAVTVDPPRKQPDPSSTKKAMSKEQDKRRTPTISRPRMASASTRTTASTKSTSTTQSGIRGSNQVSSRLVRGTAASAARSSPTNVSGPLLQGTAAIAARSSQAKSSVEKSAKSDDGISKARDRVRQRMQAKKAKEEAEAAKVTKQKSKKTPTVSADEGRARAAERVRQRQLQAQARQEKLRSGATAQPGSRVAGKENQSISSRNQQARRTSSVSGRIPSYKRTTASYKAHTLPKSPHLQTKTMHGQKKYSSSGKQEEFSQDVNPITRALGSPTHSDSKVTPARPSTVSGRPRLTVPKAPRLSTSAKYGDKAPPSLRERPSKPTIAGTTPRPRTSHKSATPSPFQTREPSPERIEPTLAESVDFMKKGLREETPATSLKRESKLTMPKPFHFHESKSSYQHPPQAQPSEPSVAESIELFSKKGLRQENPAPSAKRESKLTIPKSPNFAPISKRSRPKSQEEKEEELMEYYRSHPFRARPLPPTLTATGRRLSPPQNGKKRELTKPSPFHLRVDDRAAHAKPVEANHDKTLDDVEECKKQFHARPLPNLEYIPPPKPEVGARRATAPEPFRLTAEKKPHAVSDETELSKQFHARPLPKSNFIGPVKPTERSKSEPTESKPSTLKEKQQEMLEKKREKHLEAMKKACLRSPLAQAPIQPFQLRSESRHEEYQRRLTEKRQLEEEEERRMMSFHAQRVVRTTPPAKIQSERPRTEPRPFRLESTARHEVAKQSFRQSLKQQELERDHQAQFKARPLPTSTFQREPLTPASTREVVSPQSPELHSKQRAAKRQEFDEYAERERKLTAARKKELEDRLKAEAESELQEKRRLPVSEGGMIPTAAPIGAGLYEKG